jgi:hypothetical protein
VVSYDASAKTLVVRDERDPGREVALSTERAEMGERPQASDEVRVAYREAEGRLVATRVMNLTRQKELGAKAK